MFRFHPHFHLARPLNMLMLFIGALVGGMLAAGAGAFLDGSQIRLVVAGLSAALIGGAGNSLNDVYDARIDAVNRPQRPLPSGEVSVAQAWMLWGAASFVGVLLAFFLSLTHALLALGAIVLLFAYNARLKRLPLIGNVVIALLVALVLVYGSLAVSDDAAWIGAAFAFLTTFAREVIKDIEDVRGDESARARTLPLMVGARSSSYLACGILIFTVILTPVPYLYFGYTGGYLLLVLGAAAMLFRAAWLIAESGADAAGASRSCKGGMALGLLALAFAGIP